MKYEDLKEMTFNDWNGNPFMAIVIDTPSHELFTSDIERFNDRKPPIRIIGYCKQRWVDEDGTSWDHAYPFNSLNKSKFKECYYQKRMTYRQLAMWCAKGLGEFKRENSSYVYSSLGYAKGVENTQVDEHIRVRKWGSEEWIEPTVDMLED